MKQAEVWKCDATVLVSLHSCPLPPFNSTSHHRCMHKQRRMAVVAPPPSTLSMSAPQRQLSVMTSCCNACTAARTEALSVASTLRCQVRAVLSPWCVLRAVSCPLQVSASDREAARLPKLPGHTGHGAGSKAQVQAVPRALRPARRPVRPTVSHCPRVAQIPSHILCSSSARPLPFCFRRSNNA